MSVEFEPVRLGARRRRIDPISFAAVAVAVGVAVAVMKPWGSESSAGEIANVVSAPSATAAVPAVPAATAVAPVEVPRVIQAGFRSTLRWDRIAPVVTAHEEWGVRAIVSEPLPAGRLSAEQRLAERWVQVLPGVGDDVPTARIDPGERSVVALGITFPPTHTPLDVRIWLVSDQGFEWTDMDAIDPVPSRGAFVYVRRPRVEGELRNWVTGTYRIDVLVDGSIRRLAVVIPDRISNVPDGSKRPNLHDVRPSTGRSTADVPSLSLIDVPHGLFATADRLAVPLPADEGEALDEVGAWLDLDPGTRRAPRSFVAAAYLPRATRLGVMLEERVIVMSANITRLAPGPLPTVLPEIDHTPRDGAPSSSVSFRAPNGGVWPSGVYRLSVVWADFDGLHEESWHVDLRPGPVGQPASLLAAARAWARYAGDSGIVVGTAEPLEGGPRSAVIRLVRTLPDGGTGYPSRDHIPCDGLRMEGATGTFGLAHPLDAPPAEVTARVLFEYSRSGEQPIMTASGNVPGLTLVAMNGNVAPASEAHMSRVGDDLDATWSAICVQLR